MNRQDMAAECFNSGFNCAQAVFSVFCEKYGIEKETALKISSGLGGGFRMGEVCGAASGAVLTAGLKHGHFITGDIESKTNCYAKTEEIMGKFKELQGSFICRDILGFDISDVEGMRIAKEKNLFKTKCTEIVRDTVKFLEELGY